MNTTTLNVLIVPEVGAFYAQGVEIDYAAQGASIAEVKANFALGLQATKEAYLEFYGHYNPLGHPSPSKVFLDELRSNPFVEKWTLEVELG